MTIQKTHQEKPNYNSEDTIIKRFTQTTKWIDPWFRRLSAPAKLIWFYALDHCDLIGIVELDLEFLTADCGVKCTDKNIAELGDRVQRIGENRFFIPKFIGFQYGRLSESCRPHEKVIEAVRSHSLVMTPSGYRYPTEIGYQEGFDRVSDNPKDSIGRVLEEEQDKKKTKGYYLEIIDFCKSNGLYPRDAEYLWNTWEGNGWTINKRPIKDWKAAIRAWKAQGYLPSQKTPMPEDVWPQDASSPESEPELDLMAVLMANQSKDAAREAALAQPHDEHAFD